MSQREIFGVILLGLVIGFANAGGIGGGYYLFSKAYHSARSINRFSIQSQIIHLHWVNITYFRFITILAGALGNYFRFAFLRNELNGGPIINYDLLLINVPVLASGSIFGLIIN